MSVDYSKMQLVSTASSNKIWKQGSGFFSVPVLPGAGEQVSVQTIPHGYTSDNLLFQVITTTDLAGSGDYTVLPWSSPDGRLFTYAYLDNTNLYIARINSDISGFGFPAATVAYSYRLLVP